jgi:hypothetical protein
MYKDEKEQVTGDGDAERPSHGPISGSARDHLKLTMTLPPSRHPFLFDSDMPFSTRAKALSKVQLVKCNVTLKQQVAS